MGQLMASQPRLRAYLRMLVYNPSDVNDLMQEVAAIGWKKYSQFDADRSFEAWLLGIARNCVFEYAREQGKRASPLTHEVIELLEVEAQQASSSASTVLDALDSCLGKLAADDYRLIRARFEESQDAIRLNQLLATNREARQFYTRFMAITAGLETQPFHPPAHEAADATSNTDLLLNLLRMEQDAEIAALNEPTSGPITTTKPIARLDKDLVVYISGQALRSKPARWLAAAAAILLGLIITLQFVGQEDRPGPAPVADQTQDLQNPLPIAHSVATLTTEQDAVWVRRPGQDLFAGQRLTITRGFAEITTNHGAIAIIEAPATIELTNNENAIYLHAGKLVGICETESSKGFVVSTPILEVTDLGTRFGVDSSMPDVAEVHVFDGEVKVSGHYSDPTESYSLVGGQAIKASLQDGTARLPATDRGRFTGIQGITPAAGTGVGLAVGEVDPNWKIVAIDGQALERPLPLEVVDDIDHIQRTPNDPDTAQWIAHMIGAETARIGKRYTRYTIQAEFFIPDSIDLQRTQLVAQYFADDRLVSARLNGLEVFQTTAYSVSRTSSFKEEHLMFKTSLFAAAGLIASTQAFGAVIAEDDFNSYADGSLNGANGGTGWAGGWGNASYTVTSGVVTGQGNSIRVMSTVLGTSGEVWLSFDWGFNADVNSYGGVSLYAQGGAELAIIGDWFGQDVWSGDSKQPTVRAESTIPNNSGVRTAVAKLTLGTGTDGAIDVWVGDNDNDPVDISGATAYSISGFNLSNIDAVRLGTGGASTYDNLILATTSAEVGAVPEPTSLALMGLGGLLIARRRRG
eukprot:g9560.t1